jgi:hypothetical protein
MSQTTVLDAPLVGSPGDIADLHTATDGQIVTATNANASAAIVIGTMVKRGTVERSMLTLAAQADKATAHGVLTRAHSYTEDEVTTNADTETDELAADATGGVGRTGDYVVLIEEDVDIGDVVRVRCVAGAGEIAGAFRTSQDTTDCLLLPTDAFYWVKGGTVDADTGFGVAVLHIDMNHIVRATADV